MRILVVSKEAWREDQNGGNVLSNVFSSFNAEFAQVYCTESEPNNNVCRLYYQMTDKMMFDNIIKRKRVGLVKYYDDFPQYTPSQKVSYAGAKRFGQYARHAREVLWKLAGWNNSSLLDFVKSFAPDIIFAPCYGTHYMLRLTEVLRGICNVNIISYISDDFYTNRQTSYSALFWINHFALRRHVRKCFKLYSLTYTMTDEQKEQCERDLKANMKILRKGGDFFPEYEKKSVGHPIRFIYAGGLYLNRDVTLSMLAKAIKRINEEGGAMRLDIYSSNPISDDKASILNDGVNSFLHESVSMEQLMERYHESDVALHVEGFDKKNRDIVRLSFSTKIVDCLDSGCAVMAICDEDQAGLSYLKRNDAAICITNPDCIYNELLKLQKDNSLIIEYQHKAFEIGRRNHNREEINKMLEKDFSNFIQK